MYRILAKTHPVSAVIVYNKIVSELDTTAFV